MRYLISIVLPIILLIIGFWYSFKIHRKYLLQWHKEYHFKDMLFYIIPTLIKSSVIMFLIIFIHNSFHDDHYVELILFVFVFLVFGILQSPFSIGGFLTRGRNLIINFKDIFEKSSSRADRFLQRIFDIFAGGGEILVKILIFIGFIVIFIPNITLFVTSNILYFLLFILLVGLSLIINNVIYFGFISLMIFQFEHVSFNLDNINWIVLVLSYVVIIIGLSLENRLERKMFFLITVMEVKKFNFKLGYNIVKNKKDVVVFQNIVNGYYYVYYRKIGLVVVYYSDLDIKLSEYIKTRIIKEGKRYLLSQNEPFI